jgi:hypothetical protein
MTITRKSTTVRITAGQIIITSKRNGVEQVLTCAGRTVVVELKGTK